MPLARPSPAALSFLYVHSYIYVYTCVCIYILAYVYAVGSPFTCCLHFLVSTADLTWGDIFESCIKVQSSKLERLFCHVSVKRDVRALSFELWKSFRNCHSKWDWQYIYRCVYTHTYIHTHIHIYMLLALHIYIYLHMYIYIHTYIYISMYMYVYIYTMLAHLSPTALASSKIHTYIYVYMCMFIYIHYMHAYIYIYVCIHIYHVGSPSTHKRDNILLQNIVSFIGLFCKRDLSF